MKAWDHTSTQVLPCSKKKVLKVETCLYQSPSVTDAAIAPQKWSGRVLDDPSNIFRLKINDPQKCDGEIHFRNSSTTFLWHGPNVHGQVANRRYASPVYWLHWLNRTGCFLETRIEKTHGKKNPKPPQKNVQSQHLELITSLLVALTIVPDTVLLLETKIGGKSLGTSIQTEMLSRQAACCGFNEHTIKSSEWHEYPRATRDCDPAYSVGSESPGL